MVSPSPLALCWLIFSCVFYEKQRLKDFNFCKAFLYQSCVYDIVCVLNCEGDAMKFFVILLKIFNIKFTFEKQDGGKLAFLEILISKEKDKFEPVPFAKKDQLASTH